jgi:hypothetical protein
LSQNSTNQPTSAETQQKSYRSEKSFRWSGQLADETESWKGDGNWEYSRKVEVVYFGREFLEGVQKTQRKLNQEEQKKLLASWHRFVVLCWNSTFQISKG